MELDNAGEYEYGVLRVVTEWAGTENRTSPDNIPWFDSNAVYDSAKTASTWSELGRLERLSLAIANIAPYPPKCVEGKFCDVPTHIARMLRGKIVSRERHTPSRFIADSSPCANKAGMRGE
jgi:hypothetical protein